MRVYLHTFGCKANQYDTETVRQALEGAGATVVTDPAQADAAVVNSCTVTHTGEAKMRGLVRRLARVRPNIRTVVMGCAAAVDDGTISRLPAVAGVVGGSDPARVLSTLDLQSDHLDPILRRFARGGRAWLKIQDGCDEHCTFCATTLARGANRSRQPADVVAEARALAVSHAEIVLTGVHIGSYGTDLGEGHSLGRLVDRLVREVPEVRFRLSSVEATEVDDRLADLMAGHPDRLAPHLHAPLQSGSNRLLRRMGRHWYTADSYRERIESLASRLPAFGLGADVIVGFPGETEDDHAATRAVIAGLPFTYLHVFPYSERPGAAARRLGSAVDPGTMKHRAAELRELGDAKGTAYRHRQHGRLADLVVTERHQGKLECLTEDYLTVYLSSDHETRGRMQIRLETDGVMLVGSPQ